PLAALHDGEQYAMEVAASNRTHHGGDEKAVAGIAQSQLPQGIAGADIVPCTQRVRQLHADVRIVVRNALQQIVAQLAGFGQFSLTQPNRMTTNAGMRVAQRAPQYRWRDCTKSIERTQRVQTTER